MRFHTFVNSVFVHPIPPSYVQVPDNLQSRDNIVGCFWGFVDNATAVTDPGIKVSMVGKVPCHRLPVGVSTEYEVFGGETGGIF